ncbi:MAG: hypothetical protein IPM64_05255 [Phycisphaerales bacterium]|nr:hypothetical protein [Phycisphaerales bacterium]
MFQYAAAVHPTSSNIGCAQRRSAACAALVLAALGGTSLAAEKFDLIIGVDPTLYPGAARMVAPSPGPGFPGTFQDGDRLAGTPSVGGTVAYVGTGTPLYAPNAFGSTSFLFRRGSVPAGPSGNIPLMGIEFLGGPLLDLDGDAGNGSRSLTPVSGQTPVEIPGSSSFIELAISASSGVVALVDFDASGTNEGGPNIGPNIATTLTTIAGTQPDGQRTAAINPSVDTRSGTLTPFPGAGGMLAGVYRIENLGFELWEDSIDPNSQTASTLGTLQVMGAFRGWLIERDGGGAFPLLAGQGLGSTLWPLVDSSKIGGVFNTANGLFGGTATIAAGVTRDQFHVPGNGGTALTDFGGDLGAYLDAVIAPRVPADSRRFVYLESAGFGINNSNDPVFIDSIAYDAVIIAAARPRCPGQVRCDANCDGVVNNFDIDPFVLGLVDPAGYAALHPDCERECSIDANGDGEANNFDIDAFVACLLG